MTTSQVKSLQMHTFGPFRTLVMALSISRLELCTSTAGHFMHLPSIKVYALHACTTKQCTSLKAKLF